MRRQPLALWASHLLVALLAACAPATPALPTPAATPLVSPAPVSTAPYLAPWYVEGVTVETYAGTGMPGYKDGPAAEAQFNTPDGLAVDAAGNLYVFDWFNARVRVISPEGFVSTLAGTGTPGFADGPAGQAQFRGDARLAIDAAGNIYVGDGENHRIRVIAPDGIVSTLAGTGQPGYRDGPADQAQFNYPTGVAVDKAGNVYVADVDNNRIRVITSDRFVSTLAGTGEAGYRDGPALEAQFNAPNSLTMDAVGNIVVAESIPWEWRGSRRLRAITPDGMVKTLAGSGKPGHQDGQASEARFVMLTCPVFDAGGNVLVADHGDVRVRLVTPDGWVYTLAGTGEPGRTDGPGSTAQFANPSCMTIGPQGEVYVADPGAHVIRRITYKHTAAAAPMPTATPQGKQHVIKIGYTLLYHLPDFTKFLNAARLAVDEANTAGGVMVNGEPYTLELVVASECCGAEGAVFAAESLVEQDVVAVVGHILSDSALAASPVYARVGLVHITPTAQDSRYTFAGQPTAFRVAPNAAYGGAISARMVFEDLGIRRAVLLVEPFVFQQTVAEAWEKAFRQLGGEAFHHEVSPDNLAETLDAIRDEGAEAIIIFRQQVLNSEWLVQQIRQAGLSLPIIGYVTSMSIGARSDAAHEGIYDINPGRPEGAMPGFDEFAAKYRAAHFTLFPEPDDWTAFSYDAMNIAITAVRRAAETGVVTRESVATAMETFREQPFQGVTGAIQFDEHGDRLDQPFYFKRMVNGQWVDIIPR